MSGARFGSSLRRVLLPLAWPGLLASGLYVFTIGIGAFDVPLVIGMSNRIYTFSTYLYVMSNPLNGVPRYGAVAAFASFMIVFALLLSWWYSRVLVQSRRYQVITGKAYRRRLIALGPWQIAAWSFIAVLFPHRQDHAAGDDALGLAPAVFPAVFAAGARAICRSPITRPSTGRC